METGSTITGGSSWPATSELAVLSRSLLGVDGPAPSKTMSCDWRRFSSFDPNSFLPGPPRPICLLLLDFEDSETGELNELAIVLELPEGSTIDRDLSLEVFCKNLGNLDVDGDDGDWLPRSGLLIVQWGRRRRQERGSRTRRCGGASEKALSLEPRATLTSLNVLSPSCIHLFPSSFLAVARTTPLDYFMPRARCVCTTIPAERPPLFTDVITVA